MEVGTSLILAVLYIMLHMFLIFSLFFFLLKSSKYLTVAVNIKYILCVDETKIGSAKVAELVGVKKI